MKEEGGGRRRGSPSGGKTGVQERVSAESARTLLHDGQVEGGEVRADDASAHRLAAALALPAAVAKHAGVAGGHKQPDAQVGHDALAHGEALLVLATHDLEDVALELLQQQQKQKQQSTGFRGRA